MRRLMRCLVSLLVLLAAIVPAVTAGADPDSRILDVRPLGGRQLEVVVHSAAMNKPITLWMSHPGAGAPALYLLNAVDGGEDGGPWMRRTDVADFFADKNVNVIVPIGGRASFYTDWLQDDPALGRNQWTTFLTRELPPLLESRFAMTGRNAVAGLSMSATSALNLAIGAPGMYQAVGAYSGCPRTSDAGAQALVTSQLAVFGANAANMWGAPDHPAWLAHDPTVQADRLRGVALYVSSGTGAPGEHDSISDTGIDGNPVRLIDRVLVGGVMETVVGGCTRPFVDRLHQLGIPVTANLRPAGTHAWTYWQDDVHLSWPLFAAAIGA
ncbi:putative mycolyltransferase [Nocardia brasiliensis NBRC 14402]|uniref:alpha/beta hydrolase n=1 Tax=Nocardia brasiliensis TaxID=37326 RepID=UPI0002E245F6|nr:alpha/beta hydrolase family protein [Nocardia brasiliensis]ASF12024.1 esterase family protein [Nocardia brasiliensis]GAJ82852.1 putative mycolyltransferase [Nocardia brasiliensis NBRC 14402]SUB09100.1 Mycolyl transferase 85A [Nocardia brasiliensis]